MPAVGGSSTPFKDVDNLSHADPLSTSIPPLVPPSATSSIQDIPPTHLWEKNTVDPGDALPEHLCGGTYRSRCRKRKTKKPELTYKEQKERRTLKKFGANGVALGEDAETKKKLEKGKKVVDKI
ncbi:hypothetical protein QBC44DRAFT_380555 [Cladorrhinum sp. PSN332]|nr:hypothetical protein QBC44DRAFT_380555 [Cladorrhinum sp. PSN332]